MLKTDLFYLIYKDMIDYLYIGSIISGSIIFASHIKPWEEIKIKLGLHYTSKMFSENMVVNYILRGIRTILNCGGCISFWISLVLLKDLKLSLIIYCLTYFLANKINSVSL